jgi:hypothetical protein
VKGCPACNGQEILRKAPSFLRVQAPAGMVVWGSPERLRPVQAITNREARALVSEARARALRSKLFEDEIMLRELKSDLAEALQ